MQMTTARRLTVALLLAGVLLFGVGLSYAGGPFGPDEAVMRWMIAHRTVDLIPVVSTLSDVFGPMMIAIWTMLVAVVLLIRDRNLIRATALAMCVAIAGILTEIVKMVVARPRPPLQFHIATPETGFSYPSGHVAGICTLAVACVVVVCTASTARWIRWCAAVMAAVITLAVAVSRMYLGVHWISDVVAAMAIGVAVPLVIPELVVAMVTELDHRRDGRMPRWFKPRSTSTNRNPLHAHR
ncbi:phosphatase PAP2 family protein [Gordonia bronchialis]|jgi:undecaprenyl-diphosphatase|uniref:phosphatase PAP2 family protein n=1 Tax=Gordonia bronchialis TaxID=2054 RepID=UPI00242F78C7|nr:phosphatase PAP2 family protein [Gordonia bronchialis]